MNEELNPSILGSKEYWDDVYSEEMKNFQDFGDVGEIWFGRQVALRIVQWINEKSEIQKNDSILDLGCGNGMFLMDLYAKGYRNLYGVDYSKSAIDLAAAISKSKKFDINFSVNDILDIKFQSPFSVVLDKGTFDSISLNPEDSKTKRKIYVDNLKTVLKKNGIFIIASCNWTETELLNHFSDFEHLMTLPAPTFKFGGYSGKTVTTVIFKKR